MVEPDTWLHAQAAALGINPAHIGPASVDVELDYKILVKYYPAWLWRKLTRQEVITSIVDLREGPYWLLPGHLYLCNTVETVRIPQDHGAQIMLRSSFAREGATHNMAGWLDPGFPGQVTMELSVVTPVRVTYRRRIAQLVFFQTAGAVAHPYQGKYAHQRGPTESYEAA